MMRETILAGAMALVAAHAAPLQASAVDDVNPFVGSGGIGFGVGSLNPGPYTPHGMMKMGPDTSVGPLYPSWAHCGGYWYPDPDLRAFTLTHPSGIGVADYGNIGFMPTFGFRDTRTREANYRSAYDHATEEASAGYYAVTLTDSDIRVELTALDRAGIQRYTFPAGDEATLIIDPTIGVQGAETADAYIEYDPITHTLRGWQHYLGLMSRRFGGFTVYFHAELSRDMPFYGVWVDGDIQAGQLSAQGQDVGLALGFDAAEGDVLEARIGISYLSMDQAATHLDADLGDRTFAEVVAEARDVWADALGVIEVEGGTEAERKIFYSTLYRTTGMPTDFTEEGDLYLGFDGQVRGTEGHRFFSDLSLWDTYRTANPLYALIYPEVAEDILVSLGRMYAQSGDLPRWPMAQGETGAMIGEPAEILFADALMRGIPLPTLEQAWPGMGERGNYDDQVEAYGYMTYEAGGGSVSRQLEYALNDQALSVVADYRGDATLAEQLRARSLSYANLFNPATGFFQARSQDGTFKTPFFPHGFYDDYTEGNAWQLLWFVPHDPEGHVALIGGPNVFAGRLNRFFEASVNQPDTLLPDANYWHGNEPDIQASYLFNYVGRHDLTAKWVRWVMDAKYRNGPDGLDGNDDGGTLSAWYVFSAMGIFPVPAQSTYLIGTPLFERSVIHLAGGDFIIEAPGASAEMPFVQSATLNGQPLLGPHFDHSDMANGGRLTLVVGATPSTWGADPAHWPRGPYNPARASAAERPEPRRGR